MRYFVDDYPLRSLNTIVPSAAEVGEIKGWLSTAPAQLEALDSEILEQRKHLAALEAERAGTIKRVEHSKVLIAPYKKLPPELLALIFSACLSGPISLPPKPSDVPILLSHVCRSWRDMAIAFKELWSNFSVCVSPRYADVLIAVSAARTLFARHTHPLSLELQGNFYGAAMKNYSLGTPLMDFVIPYSTKFRSLKLGILPGMEVNRLLSLPRGSFPLLENLSLFIQTDWEPHVVTRSMDAFLGHSCLRSITIQGCNGPVDLRHVIFPWSQLEELITPPLHPESWHSILQQCVSLKYLSIELGVINAAFYLRTLPVIELPELHTCIVRFSSSMNYVEFFRPLVLPAIRTLKIRCHKKPDVDHGWSQSCLTSLVHRSLCAIQTLHVGDFTVSHDLAAILECSPSLKELYITENVGLTAAAVNGLSTGDLAPLLEELSLKCSLNTVLDILELRQAFRSPVRKSIGSQTASRLKKVCLSCPRPNKEEQMRLNKLEESGLQIALLHYAFFAS